MEYCVMYKPHGALNIEQRVFGPFDYEQAESVLIHLGALGAYDENKHEGQPGWKYIQPLEAAPC